MAKTKGDSVTIEGTTSWTDPKLKGVSADNVEFKKGKTLRNPKKETAHRSRHKAPTDVPAVIVQPPAPEGLPAQQTDADREAVAFVQLLERVAKDPTVDVHKMREFLNMKKEIMQDNRIAAFNRDYMLAKLEMPRVKKDGTVEYLEDKNKPDGAKKKAFNYAKYEDIDRAIRPIEQKYGFARLFTTTPKSGDGGGCIVHCKLLHRDGHFQEGQIAVALDASGGKNNIQAMGSSFSYGKRYTTEMLWDIVKEGADDDGNNAETVLIDDTQFAAFQKLIDENNVDTARFCALLKVDSLRAIRNKDYPKAMADLKAGIEKKKQKAAELAAQKGGK